MRAIAAFVMLLTLCSVPAAAQRGAFGLGQDLRLEGVVDPSAATKGQALGTIKIRAGKTVRKFAVFRAQTARAARLLELRTAATQIATVGEYYALRARSTRATYVGIVCGLAGTAIVLAFAWPPA